jgi:hypothetical protein
MESHDDGTGVVLPRRSRWVLSRSRNRIGRGEQRDGGKGDDFDRTRRPPVESTGWIKLMLMRCSRFGRGERKHLMISF